MSSIIQQITAFEVYPNGLNEVDRTTWSIRVEHRGEERWAVTNLGRCLNRYGIWDSEPLPSSRTEEWLAAHRFSRDEALTLARLYAPDVTWNGMSAAYLAARSVVTP